MMKAIMRCVLGFSLGVIWAGALAQEERIRIRPEYVKAVRELSGWALPDPKKARFVRSVVPANNYPPSWQEPFPAIEFQIDGQDRAFTLKGTWEKPYSKTKPLELDEVLRSSILPMDGFGRSYVRLVQAMAILMGDMPTAESCEQVAGPDSPSYENIYTLLVRANWRDMMRAFQQGDFQRAEKHGNWILRLRQLARKNASMESPLTPFTMGDAGHLQIDVEARTRLVLKEIKLRQKQKREPFSVEKMNALKGSAKADYILSNLGEGGMVRIERADSAPSAGPIEEVQIAVREVGVELIPGLLDAMCDRDRVGMYDEVFPIWNLFGDYSAYYRFARQGDLAQKLLRIVWPRISTFSTGRDLPLSVAQTLRAHWKTLASLSEEDQMITMFELMPNERPRLASAMLPHGSVKHATEDWPKLRAIASDLNQEQKARLGPLVLQALKANREYYQKMSTPYVDPSLMYLAAYTNGTRALPELLDCDRHLRTVKTSLDENLALLDVTYARYRAGDPAAADLYRAALRRVHQWDLAANSSSVSFPIVGRLDEFKDAFTEMLKARAKVLFDPKMLPPTGASALLSVEPKFIEIPSYRQLLVRMLREPVRTISLAVWSTSNSAHMRLIPLDDRLHLTTVSLYYGEEFDWDPIKNGPYTTQDFVAGPLAYEMRSARYDLWQTAEVRQTQREALIETLLDPTVNWRSKIQHAWFPDDIWTAEQSREPPPVTGP